MLFAVIITMLFGSLFSSASAATVSIINNWQSPVPYSFYSFASPVSVVGAYTLPPNWVGTIYIWQDGVQLPQTLTVDNLAGVTPKNGVFNIPIVNVPGVHEISIEFFGGASCFILNICPGTSSNWTDESIVPRTYTAAATPDPVLTISYDANGTLPLQSPAFDFANVVTNTTDTRTLYVRNIGGGVANGAATIAGGANPFYCIGTCTYAIPAGAPAVPIQVQYAPTSSGLNSTGLLAFGCSSMNCSGVNANLVGSSIANPLPPQMGNLPYGFWWGSVNVGSYEDLPFTINNDGGGVLTGTINIDQPDFTCVPGCNYSVPSGGSMTMTFRFSPTVGGTRYISAHFVGNFPTIDKGGSGNGIDKPVIQINCVGCYGVGNGNQYHWDIPTPVGPGQTVYQDIEVTNIGVGSMNGSIDNTPGTWNTLGWHCTGVTQGGVLTTYTDATACAYTNLVNGGPPAIVHMEFTGSVANIGPVNTYIVFSETQGSAIGLTLDAIVSIDPLLQIQGLGTNIHFVDTLINVPTADIYNYPNDFITLTNIGTTPLSVVINLPVGTGVFTCANPVQCNTPIIIAAGGSVDVSFLFNPATPYYSYQDFSICLGTTCGNYTMDGWGQNPQLGVTSVIPGGENMDVMKICAQEGGSCAFTGTKLVYYGNNTSNISKNISNGAICSPSTFGSDPLPNVIKYCWHANDETGTWINKPWTTSNLFRLYNSGIGGRVYYQITSPANFKCNGGVNLIGFCSGRLTNSDGGDFTSTYDIDHAPIYFNPSGAGGVAQNLTISYHYVAWDGVSPPDCNYCHTLTIPLNGTGLTGPHLSYSMATFPTTNVGASTVANLTVINDGTDPAVDISVNYVSGMFSCTSNCGPYTIPAGGSQTAQITFSPTSAGTKNGSFRIDAAVVGVPPGVTVPVTGLGNVSPIVGILNPVGGSLDYGVVNQGSQRISGDGTLPPIIVTNTGAGLLTGDVTLLDTVQYVCITCHYEALANGMTQEVKIAFVPKTVSPPALNNTANFSGGTSPLAFLLYGQGALGASSVNSPDTNFGRVVIRPGNFKEQVVTVYNNGSVDVPGGTITLTGPFSCTHPPTPYNALAGKCSYPNIPAGGSVTFTLRFTPVAPGAASGVLSLGGSSNARIRLSGTGVVPSVKFKEK